MPEQLNKKLLWNNASTAGAVLGLGSTAIMFLDQLVTNIGSPVAATALSMLLWLVKFVGCIWLMWFFMNRLCRTYKGVTNSDTMKFGTITALLSALIYSALLLANMLFISPEQIQAQYDEIFRIYSGVLDSNTMNAVENLRDSMPQITFFSQLIYCFVYGTVLSLILSRFVPKKDPFAENRTFPGNDDRAF